MDNYDPNAAGLAQPAAPDSWALATLGQAIGVYVDRQINNPQVIANSGTYGIGADGQIYQVGQPATPTVQVKALGSGGGSGNMLLLILLAAFIASRH